jgi:thymidine phosphorylase
VRESVEALTDPAAADPRLLDVTLALARRLLTLAGLDADPEAALRSGAAAERFGAMVAALGGPADLLERPGAHLPAAPVVRPVPPEHPGLVSAHATRELGLAVMALGGGRRTEADAIDPAVGLSAVAPPGAAVGPGAPLAVVHARDEAGFAAAQHAVRAAMVVSEAPAGTPAPAVTEEV